MATVVGPSDMSPMTKLAVGVCPVGFELESKAPCSRTLSGLLGESGPIIHMLEASDQDGE